LGGLIWWIVVGLIAGWLAGKVMKGGGFGVLMDIVIGMVGAILGGWAFGLLRYLFQRRLNRIGPGGVRRCSDSSLASSE